MIRKRRRTFLLLEAIWFPAALGGLWLTWDTGARPIAIAVLAYGLYGLIRFLHTPEERFSRPMVDRTAREIVEAGGVPETVDGRVRPEIEVRVAIDEALDRLDAAGRRDTWFGRHAIGLGRLATGIGVLGWGGATVWLVTQGDWASVGIGLVATLLFGGAGVFMEREFRRDTEARSLLERQRARLDVGRTADTRVEASIPEHPS